MHYLVGNLHNKLAKLAYYVAFRYLWTKMCIASYITVTYEHVMSVYCMFSFCDKEKMIVLKFAL